MLSKIVAAAILSAAVVIPVSASAQAVPLFNMPEYQPYWAARAELLANLRTRCDALRTLGEHEKALGMLGLSGPSLVAQSEALWAA